MISNGKRWQYLAVKKPSALLRGITSKNNCLHSFGTKNKLKSHKIACENKDYRSIIMLSEDKDILRI